MWIKNSKERRKKACYESSKYQGLSATLGGSKEYDDTGLHLHKRKDSGAQWLYRYTISTGGVVKWAWVLFKRCFFKTSP
ncbi:hypothetical protein [Bartonella machadoae]|uniref:hypothetical protein n=1 Tax=Bartonella machadoae TaxID=2893471 RepID=UPI003564DEB6